MNTRKIIFLSILVAQALVLFIIESMIPLPFIAPGAKLGLANIVIVISLYAFSFWETLLVLLLKIVLSTFFVGSFATFLYSLFGGIFSLLSMYSIKKLGKHNISVVGVSIIGAMFHNIGQITAAALVIKNINIFVYLPVLFITSIVTGLFIGMVSKLMLHHLNKIKFISKISKKK
jgi:heptaprenyl diphosphate synthase